MGWENARAEEIGRLRVEIQSLKGLQNKAAELADAIDDHGFKDEVSSLHEMLVMFGALMRVNTADRRQKLKSLKEEEE
ncbi:hypothetical protein HMPREF9374_2551 [Desmospora sp. 8437]|uniref:Uncharacterized protein n=1 Tax=Kroppenstedtia guangzhouensis TaxID=1274356 RepID=A0ABQ1GN44_9BACL|nr:hypothetical protein HMPREF9374_2551 [Desmospora sp. 8437]GGA46898.1 hypothetical protein GCM10007416_20100 [Kroppenstedtia guangzhouensis]